MRILALGFSVLFLVQAVSCNRPVKKDDPEDRALLEQTDADRKFCITIQIQNDSMVRFFNNFNGNDTNPLKLNPDNFDFRNDIDSWFGNLSDEQRQRLRDESQIHISLLNDTCVSILEKVSNRKKISC